MLEVCKISTGCLTRLASMVIPACRHGFFACSTSSVEGGLGLPWPGEDTCEIAPALLAIFGVAISCMAEFFSILKRKSRGSSSSSESGALTPKEKRFCEPSFEADDEVNIALNMAEDFGSKLQLVLQKLQIPWAAYMIQQSAVLIIIYYF